MAESSGTKTGALFIGALLFGIAAGLLTWFYLGVQEKRIAAKYAGEDEEMVAVVVANQDLSKGTRLNKALLATRHIPAKFVHANAINPGDRKSVV